MSNTEYPAVIKFFTRKGQGTTEITKELADVYGDSAPSYRTVAKWVAEFRDPYEASKMHYGVLDHQPRWPMKVFDLLKRS